MAAVTSVIIAVRNGANFLAEAVDSALTQLGPDDEVLVVWDDSDDDTELVLKRLGDPRIRVIKGPGRGVSGGRNAGLAAATGTFTAFLDHDDLWPQNRHRTMMRMLFDEPNLGAVFGRLKIQLDPGATPWQWILDLDDLHAPGTNLGAGLFRSHVLHLVKGFDESLRFGEDVDYFLRLQEAGMRIALCDVDGLIYRRHTANCTNDQRAVQNSVFDILRRKLARARGPSAQMTNEYP